MPKLTRERMAQMLLILLLAAAFPLCYRLLQSGIGEIAVSFLRNTSDSEQQLIDRYFYHAALINCLPGLVFIALFALLSRPLAKAGLVPRAQRSLKIERAQLKYVLLLSLALYAAITYVLIMLPISQQTSEEYQQHMSSLKQSPMVYVLLFEIVLAPICEELAYRAGFFAQLKKIMPLWAALLAQGVLFGLIHGNIIQSSYAAVLGIILALIYYWTESLGASIVVHMLFNAGNYTFVYFIVPRFAPLIVPLLIFTVSMTGYLLLQLHDQHAERQMLREIESISRSAP